MITHPQENRFHTDTYRNEHVEAETSLCKTVVKAPLSVQWGVVGEGGLSQPGRAALRSLIRCDALKVELHLFRARLTSNGLISHLARTAANLYWQTLGRLDYKFEARLKWRSKEICLISAFPPAPYERSPVPRPLRPVSSDRSPGGNTSPQSPIIVAGVHSSREPLALSAAPSRTCSSLLECWLRVIFISC